MPTDGRRASITPGVRFEVPWIGSTSAQINPNVTSQDKKKRATQRYISRSRCTDESQQKRGAGSSVPEAQSMTAETTDEC